MGLREFSLVKSQQDIFRLSKKLRSFGFLLELQGDATDGTTELEGLGMVLAEMGEELEAISVFIDNHLVIQKDV